MSSCIFCGNLDCEGRGSNDEICSNYAPLLTTNEIYRPKEGYHLRIPCVQCGELIDFDRIPNRLNHVCKSMNYSIVNDNTLKINKNMVFEPPIFMKAALLMDSLLEFKCLFEQSIQINNNEVICDLSNPKLKEYIDLWITGLRDPFSGMANYLGLLGSGQLNFTRLNHSATIQINDISYILDIKKIVMTINKMIAYLSLEKTK